MIFLFNEIPAYRAVAPEEPATFNSYPQAVRLTTNPKSAMTKKAMITPQ